MAQYQAHSSPHIYVSDDDHRERVKHLLCNFWFSKCHLHFELEKEETFPKTCSHFVFPQFALMQKKKKEKKDKNASQLLFCPNLCFINKELSPDRGTALLQLLQSKWVSNLRRAEYRTPIVSPTLLCKAHDPWGESGEERKVGNLWPSRPLDMMIWAASASDRAPQRSPRYIDTGVQGADTVVPPPGPLRLASG